MVTGPVWLVTEGASLITPSASQRSWHTVVFSKYLMSE